MGAYDFTQTAKGRNAAEAFSNAVTEAAYEHGHGGYTGTCAEKREFLMVMRRAEESVDECVYRLTESNDKWGPAFCLDLGGGEFLFFGLASS